MLDALMDNDTMLDGVAFTIAEGFSKRNCLVLRQALYMLSDDTDPQDLQAIYRRNEHRIQQAARRMINSGFSESPLIVGPWSFRANHN